MTAVLHPWADLTFVEIENGGRGENDVCMFIKFKYYTCYSHGIMPQLTEGLRIIGQLQVGTPASVVARFFNVDKTTVNRTRRRFNQTESTKKRPNSGRPSKTTPAKTGVFCPNI